VLHSTRNFLLSAVLTAAGVDLLLILVFGALSDRIGRKRMYTIGAVISGLYAMAYFPLLNTGIPWVIFLAIVLSLVPHSMVYGPQAALIAECFTPRLRYSGASIGYQLASIVAGGPAPFISTWLFATYNSTVPIGIYVVLCAIITIIATLRLPEYTKQGISTESA